MYMIILLWFYHTTLVVWYQLKSVDIKLLNLVSHASTSTTVVHVTLKIPPKNNVYVSKQKKCIRLLKV